VWSLSVVIYALEGERIQLAAAVGRETLVAEGENFYDAWTNLRAMIAKRGE
jgi:hypothetical protein